MMKLVFGLALMSLLASACKKPCREDTVYLTLTSTEDLSTADVLKIWIGDNPASTVPLSGFRSGAHYEVAFDQPYASLQSVDFYVTALRGSEQLAAAHSHPSLSDVCSAVTLELARPGAVDATQSSLTASPGIVRADGVDAATMLVRARDAEGRPVAFATVAYETETPGPQSGVTDADGVFSYQVRSSTVDDDKKITANLDGVTLTAAVKFVAVSVIKLENAGEQLHADGEEAAVLEVTLRDDAGQPMSGQTLELIVLGDGHLSAPLPTDANGQTRVIMTSTLDGENQVFLVVPAGASAALPVTVVFGPDIPQLTNVSASSDGVSSSCWTVHYDVSQRQSLETTITIGQSDPLQGAWIPIGPAMSAGTSAVASYEAKWETNPSVRAATNVRLRVVATVSGGDSTTVEISAAVNNTPQFMTRPPITVGDDPSAIATADFNGDGKLDVAVSNRLSANVSVLLGNGAGTFIAATSSPISVGAQPVSLLATDLNNDGKIDLVTADAAANALSVFVGAGDGTFTAKGNPAVGAVPVFVTAVDLNTDGKQDLVVANKSADNVSVLLGNGDGTFQPQMTATVGDGPAGVAVGDLNHDGHPDVVAANSLANTASVLLGVGDGTFQPQTVVSVGSTPQSIVIGDFDDDGMLDVASGNKNGNDVSVLLGIGNGSFKPQQKFGVGNAPYFIAVADMNGDGRADLVSANNSSDSVSVLLSNQDGSLTPQTSFAVGDQPIAVASGDINSDGALDLVVANSIEDSFSVVMNLRPLHCQ